MDAAAVGYQNEMIARVSPITNILHHSPTMRGVAKITEAIILIQRVWRGIATRHMISESRFITVAECRNMSDYHNRVSKLANDLVHNHELWCRPIFSGAIDGQYKWKIVHDILAEAFAMHQLKDMDNHYAAEVRSYLFVSATYLVDENRISNEEKMGLRPF